MLTDYTKKQRRLEHKQKSLFLLQRRSLVPKPLPDDVIKHWPEVFRDIDIQTIPINYLHSIRIEFKKGKIWEIDCNAKRSTGANLDDTIADLFNEYGDDIVHVDFRLNTTKVKRDVQKQTRAFLKNPTKKKK